MPIARGASRQEQEERIALLVSQLDLEEKVAMLSGHGFMKQIAEDGRYCARMYHIGAGNDRLGIPQLLFNDGPRGVAMGHSTCFPVPMARGASFDVEFGDLGSLESSRDELRRRDPQLAISFLDNKGIL